MKKTIAIVVCIIIIIVLAFALVIKNKDNPSVNTTPTATIGANMEEWSVKYPDGVTFFNNDKEIPITHKTQLVPESGYKLFVYKISVPVGTKEVIAKLSGADDTKIELDRSTEKLNGVVAPSSSIKPNQQTISEVLEKIKKCYEAYFSMDNHARDNKEFVTEQVYKFLVSHPPMTDDKLPEGKTLSIVSHQPHLIDGEHMTVEVQPCDGLSDIITCNLEKQNGKWIVTEFGMSSFYK